jgi:hypothetical protein
MEIQDKILEFQKTRNVKEYAALFMHTPSEIEKLVELIVLKKEYPFSEYSSWLLTHVVQEKPMYLKPFQKQLIDVVLGDNNQSVLRNCVKILLHLSCIEYRETEMLDRYLSFIQNHENKVALQVYSMYSLVSYIARYPELKGEFISIFELNIQDKSAAYKGGVKNFLKMTKKY